MTERDPTNGELAIMIKDLTSTVNDIKTTGSKTLEQTQRTNGRVTNLEFWRTAVVWFLGFCASCAVGFVVFAVPYGIRLSKDEIVKTVQTSFDDIANNYNIKVTN